jgi:hypothetical protein
MEIEVVQWRGSEAGAGTSPTFIGEDELLVRIFEEQVLLLDHSDSEVRGEAIRCISVNLDLTKTAETRTLMKSILETQLWKEGVSSSSSSSLDIIFCRCNLISAQLFVYMWKAETGCRGTV